MTLETRLEDEGMPKERTLTENVSPHGARFLMGREGRLQSSGFGRERRSFTASVWRRTDLLSGWNYPFGWSYEADSLGGQVGTALVAVSPNGASWKRWLHLTTLH